MLQIGAFGLILLLLINFTAGTPSFAIAIMLLPVALTPRSRISHANLWDRDLPHALGISSRARPGIYIRSEVGAKLRGKPMEASGERFLRMSRLATPNGHADTSPHLMVCSQTRKQPSYLLSL